MDFIPASIYHYAETHSDQEPELLQELRRQTHLRFLYPQMLSGHLQGRLLSLIAHILTPRLIVEIGTYTGYSAICLAEGLMPDGKLITIDHNEEIEKFASSYIERAGKAKQIEIWIGSARSLIERLPSAIDLVFLDADKRQYIDYYEALLPKIRPGGLLLADNVLWYGKVVHPPSSHDKDTAALHAFNQHVSQDPRVDKVLLPIRDGLYLIRKR